MTDTITPSVSVAPAPHETALQKLKNFFHSNPHIDFKADLQHIEDFIHGSSFEKLASEVIPPVASEAAKVEATLEAGLNATGL